MYVETAFPQNAILLVLSISVRNGMVGCGEAPSSYSQLLCCPDR